MSQSYLGGITRILTAIFIAALPDIVHADILYDVHPNVSARQYHITITVPKVSSSTLKFQIPTWSPGAYMIGNYAGRVGEVRAEAPDGSTLNVAHPDKLTWEVNTSGIKEAKFTYVINNADLVEADGAPKRGHISGPSTYIYIVDRKTEPVVLSLHVPRVWKIATSLDPGRRIETERTVGEAWQTFTAPNYDVLADAPVEMGDFGEDNFEVRGVPHRIVLYGDNSKVDRMKLLDYCKRIAATEISFFNDVPFKRYIFMFRCNPNGRGGGGLEHLGSTEIGINGEVSDTTRSVIAHEYFHLWNVKRIRPFVLGPFDYTQPVRTNNLWWSEGVTSYYGDLLSCRGGINSETEYLKHLGDTIGQLQSNPARLQVTADESSYKVWDGGGSQGFGRLSYYTKGELIGLCLDLKLRQVTGGKKSLDDVIRSLYMQCGKGRGPGFPEDAIRQTANKVAGRDLGAFYDQLARSKDEMPFSEVLGYAGLKSGISSTPVITADLGMFAGGDPKGLRVRFVMSGGAAEKAGLKSDDIITAVDGKPVQGGAGGPGGGFGSPVLRNLAAGAKVTLTVERDGVPLEIAYTVGSSERKPWIIESQASTTPQQKRLREAWLHGK